MAPIRILSIVWYKVLPARFGGQKGIANFNKALGKLFHLVCLCSRNNEAPADLPYSVIPELPVSKWQFLNPFVQQKIVRIAKKEKSTHIILEHPYHAKAALKARRATGALLIVHSHNIESERYRQLGKHGWKLLYKHEKRIHHQADFNLFKTEEEMNYALKHFELLPEKCMVMPYGLSRPAKTNKNYARKFIRDRHGIPSNCKILLFAATLDYAPNEQAVNNLYEQVAPKLPDDFRIIICGRNRIKGFEYLYQLHHPLIINAGEVDNIDIYFDGADAFVNPVMMGGGVQTKNLDALSHDLNVVCFSSMLSGINLSVCGGKVNIAPHQDWEAFIAALHEALSGPFPDTPPAFYDYYSFDGQVGLFAERLKGLKNQLATLPVSL